MSLDESTGHLESHEAFLKHIHKSSLDRLKRLAGEQFDSIMKSCESSRSYLQDPNPSLRRAAISAILNRWKMTPLDAKCFQSLLVEDSDIGVRQDAVSALGAYFDGSKDQHVGKLISSIISDSRETELLRVVAYYALIVLHGGTLTEFFPDGLPTFSLDIINWELVNEYNIND